ncbi:MAG: ATP-binding cassette domain-containing protein [Burkholderiales bacterium]
MSEILLSVVGLQKSFRDRDVLDLEALAFHAGESYVLTGDNGAGKSTLLRILSGLEKADSGQMRYLSKSIDLNNYPDELRREIMYVHQQPYLFDTTVADNIGYGLKLRGVAKADREEIVREALVWAGITHLGKVPPQKLSGGEKQRAALARAKVLDPKVILFDEPTANLDIDGRRQVIWLLNKMVSDKNCVVVACHDHEIINLPHMQRLHLSEGKLEEPQVKQNKLAF